jgi:hypothetical protein
MALAGKVTRSSRAFSATPRAKYEATPGASQKIELLAVYLKIR